MEVNNNLYFEEDEEGIPLSQASVASAHFIPYEEENGISDFKVFNDPIHGHILLHPLTVAFIDTPQFQRLRDIKQLGTTYLVYPGASHNRFEHCIGTAFLAGKLSRQLQSRQKSLHITDEDVLCVELAGLCHDLGHGPFSHMFDDQFLPLVRPGCSWKHEKGSCMMLDALIKENNLMGQLRKYNLDDEDIIFIKEMIAGPISKTEKHTGNWPYKGRCEEKSFLYEIVSNDRNKVDVDKWDYLARDCYHLGIQNSFDHNRFMQFIRVLQVEGDRLQICARDKESINLYEMFHTRSVLHRRAYQHRVSKAISTMICEAFILAEPHFRITTRSGRQFKLSEVIDDPDAYIQLTDNLFNQILYSPDPALEHSQVILRRVLCRKLYRQIGSTKLGAVEDIDVQKMSKEVAGCDREHILREEDLICDVVRVNYGMHDKNPLDRFMFFSKDNPIKPYHIRKEDVSVMLPDVFQDNDVLLYCKDDDKVSKAKTCFEMWCKINQIRHRIIKTEERERLTPMKRLSSICNNQNGNIVMKKLYTKDEKHQFAHD